MDEIYAIDGFYARVVYRGVPIKTLGDNVGIEFIVPEGVMNWSKY
ncbi:hypothetical protein [Rothia nasimurium]|nr:hypothetical protein [Rothia nasimurium]